MLEIIHRMMLMMRVKWVKQIIFLKGIHNMLLVRLREDILKQCLKFLLKKWELLNAYYKMSFVN